MVGKLLPCYFIDASYLLKHENRTAERRSFQRACPISIYEILKRERGIYGVFFPLRVSARRARFCLVSLTSVPGASFAVFCKFSFMVCAARRSSTFCACLSACDCGCGFGASGVAIKLLHCT